MSIRSTRALPLLAATTLLLAGCAGGAESGGGDASGCQDAVAEAAEAANIPERERRLQPAFDACESLADFAAAVARYPKALEDVDVEAYVREQCREVEALRDASLCADPG